MADALLNIQLTGLRHRASGKVRELYEADAGLILISTDHGRRDDGGHGGDSEKERRVFFLASGPSVTDSAPDGDIRIVDVATTAMAHLGIAIDDEWDLDGRVVGLSPAG